MKEHCTEPLFVFQVFSVGLWWLDGYREYCLCTLFGSFVFEYFAVKLWLALLSDLLRVRVDSNMLMTYRCGIYASGGTSFECNSYLRCEEQSNSEMITQGRYIHCLVERKEKSESKLFLCNISLGYFAFKCTTYCHI